jgi:hypothetical protein
VSEHHLPDNPASWPSDPYEVLGVSRNVAPRDLRKAYTNLIRTFKPEHFPDQFRRIREAFESAQRYAPFFRKLPLDNEAPPSAEARPDPPSPAPAEPTAERPDPAEPSGEPLPRRPSVDELWQRAIAGDPGGAYRDLIEMLDRTPNRADLYARLYWAAVLFPEVDPDRPPAEWLVRGMDRTAAHGMLLELYASEIAAMPSAAESSGFSRLLDREWSLEQLIALVRLRWEALCRSSRWSVVLDEFEHVRGRIRPQDELVWLRLVIDIIRWVAWDREETDAIDLQTVVRTEIRSLEHLGLRHAYYFDMVEYLDVLIESWESARDSSGWPGEFLAVLRDGYALPMSHIRLRFERVLQEISDEPVRWLQLFDCVGAAGTAVLNHFSQLLNDYAADRGAEPLPALSPAQLLELASAELLGYEQHPEQFRARALRFCLDGAITPNQLEEAFCAGAWLSRLREDRSLQMVTRAFQLFRG